jgi:hypothetical protein
MNQRHDAWLARCMCAVSLVLTVLGLLFLITSRSRTGAPVYDYWLVNTVIAIGFSTVGAVITPRLPRQNPVGWLFCTIGLVGGVRLFVAEYAIVTLLAEPGSLPSTLPGGETLAWISSWVWVLGFAVPRRTTAFIPLAPLGVGHRSSGRSGNRLGGSLA